MFPSLYQHESVKRNMLVTTLHKEEKQGLNRAGLHNSESSKGQIININL